MRAAARARVRCSKPKKGIDAVSIGSVLEIRSSDPVTKTDIGAWATKVGHEFLGHATADGYDRVFVRRLR